MAMTEHRIREIFRINIILKGLHALIEIAGGAWSLRAGEQGFNITER